MIKLFQFPSAFGVPNPSPFCMKAELLVKMAGLPYENVVTTDPRKGPKGKLPAIEDDGELIGDSEIIRWHLERKYRVDFDKGLDASARAAAHAFARMLEERTYWAMVYSRWVEDRHWPIVKKAFFGRLPPILRAIVPAQLRKGTIRALKGHGLGRHSPEQVYRMGAADIAAIAAQLGTKSFFMANEPTGADATVYSLLANIIDTPFDSPLKAEALKHSNLVDYAKRMRDRFFA